VNVCTVSQDSRWRSSPTLTNLRLYLMRFMARPLGCSNDRQAIRQCSSDRVQSINDRAQRQRWQGMPDSNSEQLRARG
jgi:hypothetical protein